jgi:hypothetical protein
MESQIVFKILLIILLILLAAPLLGALAMMATGVAETSFLKERRVVTNVMLSPCGPNLVGTFTGLTRSVSIVFKRTAHRITYIRPRTSLQYLCESVAFSCVQKTKAGSTMMDVSRHFLTSSITTIFSSSSA